MLKYQILYNESAGTLEEYIHIRIADGWVPIGGVSIAHFGVDVRNGSPKFVFAQAMTKEQDLQAINK